MVITVFPKLELRRRNVICKPLSLSPGEKALCLVFKCLNGQCPEYLSNTLTRVSDISTRQSRHGSITLRCPKYSRETEGGRTFAVAAVKEWNKFPINIRSSQNVKLFKKKYVNYLKEAYIGLDHFSIS